MAGSLTIKAYRTDASQDYPRLRRFIEYLSTDLCRLVKHQGDAGIPKLDYTPSKYAEYHFNLDHYGAKIQANDPHCRKPWYQINGGNRYSITHAWYLDKNNRDGLEAKLADLTRYGRKNYGLKRLCIYLLTVNPAKTSSTYTALKRVNEKVLPTLRSIGQVAAIHEHLEDAPAYRRKRFGLYHDRHSHYVIASCFPISRRKRRDAKRQILRDCRSIYGYGQTSVDFTPEDVEDGVKSSIIAYGTKDAGLLDPLKYGHDGSGQDQAQKVYTLGHRKGENAVMAYFADELNASHKVTRNYFYINPNNAMARSWQKSIESLKKYRRNIEHPGNEPEDCSMDLFTIGKSRKRRRRVQSSHHATTVEAVRTFNGLNRYTGKELRRTREAIEARSRKILKWSRRIMADLTNEGKKSLKSLELPGLDQAKTSPEAIAEAVTANTS